MIITTPDIVNYFNDTISDFVGNGYIISPFNMCGSYTNDNAFIDLIKPNDNSHIIRIWFCNNHFTRSNPYCYMDTKNILVKKYINGIHFNNDDLNCKLTLWPSEGKLISEKIFYNFANRKNRKIYSDSKDEAIRFTNIHRKRYHNHHVEPFRKDITDINKLPSKFIELIMNRINSIRGFKQAKANCINKVTMFQSDGKFKSHVTYEFNGKQGLILFY
jgi:hypothetical protein